jgi:hypothetical protein
MSHPAGAGRSVWDDRYRTKAATRSAPPTWPELVQTSRLRSPQAISETAGPERSQHDAATSARSVLGPVDAEVADDEIVAPAKDVDQLSVPFRWRSWSFA